MQLFFQICSSITMDPGKFDPRHTGELLKYTSNLLFVFFIMRLICCFYSLTCFFELILFVFLWWIGIWIRRMRSLWKHTDQCCMNCKNFRLLYFSAHTIYEALTQTRHWNGPTNNDKFLRKELVECNTCFGIVSLSDIRTIFSGI